MKKELCALFILLVLIGASIGNYIHIKHLFEEISGHINYSQQYCLLEDYAAAYTETNKILETWSSAEKYTHVFIRHSELNEFANIVSDIQIAIKNKKRHESEILLKKLKSHTDDILKMEKPSLGTIF